MTMSLQERWLLPRGIDEVLPPQALVLERLRRAILDCYASWGYELVIPPLIEYLESLLTGMGHDLDLQTFKITDQMTGRLMGIRADITPQVARIDAHRLNRQGPTRLCYLGPVLHTQSNDFASSRNPLQIGAELYGHAGLESDLEVISLMLETLRLAGAETCHLDIGHVGIVRGLIREAGLSDAREAELFDILQRKSVPDMHAFITAADLQANLATQLIGLLDLNGDNEVLERAMVLFGDAPDELGQALADLRRLGGMISARASGVEVQFDLAELRGYHYHTGIMFAAYLADQGQAIASGGRYDDIGAVFGRARPATGFSIDLRALAEIRGLLQPAVGGISAPWSEDPELGREVARLRAAGERVIITLPGVDQGREELGCDRVLEFSDGQWRVQPAG